MVTRTWLFLSDLHLGDGEGAHSLDRALPLFLRDVVRGRAALGPCTLVLLGDTVDLHGPARFEVSLVLARLREVAAAHEAVVRALADCVQAGVRLEVVGGNHDVELTRPEVAACFRMLLGLARDDARVGFWPWVLHEQGVFYAEHGHQHYELNRLPTIAAVARPPDSVHLPVTVLGAWADGSAWCPVQRTRVRRVAGALWSARRHEALVGSSWYRGVLARAAPQVGMEVALLVELAGVTRFTWRRAVVGAVRRLVQRGLGVPPGPVLRDRAETVHRVMTRHGAPVPAYVFGHDHRARRCAISGGPDAAYCNAGTWGDQVRGKGPDRDGAGLFPFATVVHGPAGVQSTVEFWAFGSTTGSPAGPTAPRGVRRRSARLAPSGRAVR